MSGRLHLDTHVVVWLFAGHGSRIPAPVRSRLEVDELVVSPMVRLELAFLHEIGRVTVPPSRILDELGRAIGLGDDQTPFAAVARAAEGLTWTRDPFDRVIAAQSLAGFGTLVTKDQRMRDELRGYALWD